MRPDQVVDVLALMGDSIDNVKGVPGIGEKGARDLIATHGSLEALLAAAPTLTQKRYREGLLAHADQARQSRELVTIRTDVPIELDLDAYRYRPPDRAAAFELFSRLGFRSLVTEYAPSGHGRERAPGLRRARDARRARRVGRRPRDRPATSRCTSCSIRRRRCARTLVGRRALRTELGAARYIPLAPRPDGRAPVRRRGAAGSVLASTTMAAAAGTGRPDSAPVPVLPASLQGRCSRTRRVRKIGHDLKAATIVLAPHGVTLGGYRHRHRARQLRARRDALEPHARRRSRSKS